MAITTKHIFILGLILAAIAVSNTLTAPYIEQKNIAPTTNTDSHETSESGVLLPSPEILIDETMMKIVQADSTLIGELSDVTGGESSGTAYLLREKDSLYHVIEAQLPQPAESSVYEGWLVNRSDTPTFFSTGVMESTHIENLYTLSFTQDARSDGYDFVVITEETTVDEIPEKHILEGTVQ